VVRFKAPFSGTTILEDVVKGPVVFQNEELDDFILLRSDGTPTYNFVVVIDDITMQINTVIRGDDHVMNTPRQMQLYRALKAELPTYAHVPMVLGKDRTRLSKRHGAMSVTAYRDMGYLPEAFINYLVRLGWSHGDQEFFTRDELIEKFSLDHIGRAAGVFDIEKLSALNADHIQAADTADIAGRLLPFLSRKGFLPQKGPWLNKVVDTLKPRSKTLVEMADAAGFYFVDTVAYEPKAAAKFLKPAAAEPIKALIREFAAIEHFSEENLEAAFKTVMQQTGLKLGKIAQPVRVALTGRTASPGIFEIVEIIGREKVMARLKQALAYIEE